LIRAFKKITSFLFRVSISGILLIFLFRGVDKKTLFTLIKNADKPLLLFSFIIFLATHFLGFFRWNMLLKSAQIRLPVKRVIMSFSGGIFFSLFLPSTIGGDFVRSVDLASHTKKPREVIATVFLDRLSGYIGLVSIALLGMVLGYRLVQDRAVFVAVGILAVILIFGLLVLFNRGIYSKINKLISPKRGLAKGKFVSAIKSIQENIASVHQEIHHFRGRRKLICNNILLSLTIQVIVPISFSFIGLSLGIHIPIVYFFVFLPIIGAITMLPISLGGLGLRDATMIYFFAQAGVSKDLAFAMSLLNFFYVLLCGAIGGVIYVLTVRHRRIQRHTSPLIHPQS
jgi:uncharacterized protein (TIRG00374 family)